MVRLSIIEKQLLHMPFSLYQYVLSRVQVLFRKMDLNLHFIPLLLIGHPFQLITPFVNKAYLLQVFHCNLSWIISNRFGKTYF